MYKLNQYIHTKIKNKLFMKAKITYASNWKEKPRGVKNNKY